MKSLSRNHWLGLFILFCLALIVLPNLARHPVLAQTGIETPEPPRVDEDLIRRQAFFDRFVADASHSEQETLEPATAVPCVNGFAGQYPCLEVDLMAYMSLAAFSAGSANDIWGWTDPLDGKEYALVGLDNGTAFVNITDPENPIYLGKLPTHTSSSLWRDIKVYNDYAFVVSEAGGHGMQVFDLTNLRNVPNPPVTFSETTHYNQFGNAHNIAINEDTGYAYAIGSNTCSGGLHMVNIQNPLSPSNAGCFSADGYTHDTQCVLYTGPDTTYQGHEICFSFNEDTVTITDVTNKTNPIAISINPYAGSAYTHQGWITEDQLYLMHDDELDESNFGHNTRTRIWDISDLDDPDIIGIHDGPNPSIDHNLYTHDGFAYMSNYTSGLQIYDLTDIANGNLTLVAFFDSYPTNNATSFDGSWSNYPYFESGIVVHTGIGEGLFITRPGLNPTFALEAEDENLTVCTPGVASTFFTLTDQHGYTQTVTMSAENLPLGSGASFDPMMIQVPGSSTMTVTVSSTSAGIYPFTVIGTDSVLTETVDLSLTVYDALPGAVTLTSPADGAEDVPVPVTFSWSSGSQAVSYNIEIATDAAFSNVVYSANVVGTSHVAEYAFAEVSTYYWRVQSVNPCGDGTFSAGYSFTTEQIPPILVVDDDDNSPNVRNYYTYALDQLGQEYDIWNTNNTDNEPTLADLAPYEIVIWFTGDEFGGASGPASGSEQALADWLDNTAGCFFLSSQDYFYDRGLTGFMQDYLGVDSLSDGSGNYSYANGQGVFEDLGSRVLLYPFTDQSDSIVPDGTASLGIVGNNGNGAGVVKDSTYKATFWAFPLEAIYGEQHRRTAINLFLNWCMGDEPTPTPTPTVTPTPTATPPPKQEQTIYLPMIQR